MEADPGGITSVVELARRADVGVRTLQEAFRRHVGITPLAYLREARLTQTHEALLAADARRGTVARIAREAGFTHLGRFAAAYRARYGINPSVTLHQHPQQASEDTECRQPLRAPRSG